jgi:hypothetical protein
MFLYSNWTLVVISNGQKNVGGASWDWSSDIAADASGNVFACGHFSGTSDFDPGAASAILISNGSDDAYVLKLDVIGNFVWVVKLGGTDDDRTSLNARRASRKLFKRSSLYSVRSFLPNVFI